MNEARFAYRAARPEYAPRLHDLRTPAVRTLCAPHYSAEVIDGWLRNWSPILYLPPIERSAIFIVMELPMEEKAWPT